MDVSQLKFFCFDLRIKYNKVNFVHAAKYD